MKKQQTIVLTLFLFGCSLASLAANYYVSPVGSADPNGSAANPYATIQAALDVVGNGDTIILLSGLYTGVGNRNLTPAKTGLTIRSVNPADPAIAEQTIIDPNQLGCAFFLNNQSAGLVLEGLTIRNGNRIEEDIYGGGINCDNASPTIRHCRILLCSTNGYGGAFFCDAGSHPVVQNSILLGNTASRGAAICVQDSSSIQMTNCTIAGNSAFFDGPAILCDISSQTVLKNSIVWDNQIIYPENGNHQIAVFDHSTVSVSFSDIQDGLGGIYRNGDPTAIINWLDGNIAMNPLFSAFNLSENPLNWDVHLQSQYGRWNSASLSWALDAQTSPCIDSADAATDWSMEPWPNGKRANMGAYGNTIQASMNGNKADFDISGTVDMLDFAAFCDNWLSSTDVVMDFDGSGLVDTSDLIVFAQNWLWIKP